MKKHMLIRGTLILTITGLVTRIIGFFYRIFLSHTIGAEGMGIYQLIFPIHSICFSLTVAGIQTAISRFVAAKVSTGDDRSAKDTLYVGLGLSTALSFLAAYLLFQYAPWLSVHMLGEPRCSVLLQITAISIPFGSIHACINGYYYGLQKTSVPAMTQLIEQVVRVACVYLLYLICLEKGFAVTASIAVIGLAVGELVSTLYSLTALGYHFHRNPVQSSRTVAPFSQLRNIITLSLPLTANRVLINLLQSAEAILIPGQLRLFGMDNTGALSVYGVLTGMSMPLILFPSAITNSVSVMLLPAVAEAQARNDRRMIARTIENTIKYCLILGIMCTGVFLAFGDEMGLFIFNNEMAGSFIVTLAWICPFLYLTTTLFSIMNGLGKTTTTFLFNMFGLGVRIAFVFFCVPRYGIQGYLWGVLASELVLTFMGMFVLNREAAMDFPLHDWVVKPVISILIAIGGGLLSYSVLKKLSIPLDLIVMGISAGIICVLYVILLLAFGALHLRKPYSGVKDGK
ncbi:putative polysaccharide biosynthesis protein [Diplocloster agilis]|uniref:Polysaccharide biosynthesis protein n=1 Tax=Diplocloster agilis TaxID=2850323 RepID=A0A949K035_9FIRM|nr:polysaccharide biosynthesis protein [Diplocloster agilis]MBU9737259.1 polysaccharide biosynthesis protein [Diplocloster agilis]